MTEVVHQVGGVDDFAGGVRRFIRVGTTEIGVLCHRGTFYAFANACPHQGGPVCEGLIFDRVTEDVDAGGKLLGSRFIEEEPRLVCPWHGVEFELATGVCPVDPRLRLRTFPVVLDGDLVGVVA